MFVLVLVASGFLSLVHHTAGVEVFFYFAYGSNMLSNRIKIHNNSSVYYGPAMLEGNELEFRRPLPMWNGAVANYRPNLNNTVWGTLWLIDSDKIDDLDRQEGVKAGWYRAVDVVVKRPDGYRIKARAYVEVNTVDSNPPSPIYRLPSETYLKVMILGAIESKLPNTYVDYLRSLETNKEKAPEETIKTLGEVILTNMTVHRFD